MEQTSESQIKELISYMKDPNVKVRVGALDIALQISRTAKQRESFANTDVIKQSLRLFNQLVSILIII